MTFLKIFLIALLESSFIFTASVRTFNIESFNSCTKGQYLAQTKELSITNDHGKLLIYGELNLNETIRGPIEVIQCGFYIKNVKC